MNEQLFTISVFTQNRTGMLQRVAMAFTRRKLNIESITCSESETKGVHQITFVVRTIADVAINIVKQMEKQIDVLRAVCFKDDEVIFQEVALYKVSNCGLDSAKIETIVHEHNARVLQFSKDYVVIEKTGNPAEIQNLYDKLLPWGLIEFVRSGRVALSKPFAGLKNEKKTGKMQPAIV